MEQKKGWRRAFRDTIPVMAGYLVLGMGFGILLRSWGFGLWWALGMSALIYAGSMQYVGVGLLTGGAGVLTTAVTTLPEPTRLRTGTLKKKVCHKTSTMTSAIRGQNAQGFLIRRRNRMMTTPPAIHAPATVP